MSNPKKLLSDGGRNLDLSRAMIHAAAKGLPLKREDFTAEVREAGMCGFIAPAPLVNHLLGIAPQQENLHSAHTSSQHGAFFAPAATGIAPKPPAVNEKAGFFANPHLQKVKEATADNESKNTPADHSVPSTPDVSSP